MFVKLNPKNSFVFLLAVSFLYLAYLIWTAKEALPPIDVELREIVSYIVLAVEMGGNAVARIHAEKGDLSIREKGAMDVGRAELLTKADETSNLLMLELLNRIPLLRVISEEKSTQVKATKLDRYRADNYELWLGLRETLSKVPNWRVPLRRIAIWIDPLDATQEYTEGLTEFVTVMACIAIDGKPVIGAIHRPFKNETVLGMVDFGLISSRKGLIKIERNKTGMAQNRTVLVSRSHAGDVSKLVERAFSSEHPPYVVEPAGGAGYKVLRLVEQSADLYVHTTAIKKWDLCAGDAIIRAAGGALISLSDGSVLDYSIGRDGIATGQVHAGGILAALSSPYSLYERLRSDL